MRFASQPLKFKWPRASLIAVVLTAAPHGGGPAAATTPPGDDAAAMALTFETLGRRLAHDGDRDGAGRAMGKAVPYLRQLLAAEPADPERMRDLAVALLFSGYQQRVAGNAASPPADLAEGARLRRTLARPDDEDARTLDFEAAALAALGDALAEHGDLSGARRADEEAHGLFARLASANPQNVRLSVMNDVTLGALADVLTAQGALSEARADYDELLLDVRVRATSRPDSLDERRALAMTLRAFAESAIVQGDLAAARRTAEESISAFRTLTDADPADISLQAEADRAFNDLGDVLALDGDAVGARRAYLRALADERRYGPANSAPPSGLLALATTFARLGALDGSLGEFERGRKALTQSQDALDRLAPAASGDVATQDLLAFDANATGQVLTGLGALAGAEDAFGKNLVIGRRMVEASPRSVAAQARLIQGLIEAYAVYQGRAEPVGAQASLSEARVALRRLDPAVTADPKIGALSAAVGALAAGGSRAGWSAVAARTEILFRNGAFPRLDLAWLAAVRARAGHRPAPVHPRPKPRRRATKPPRSVVP